MNKKKSITILGDSLSMPRKKDGIAYENTYSCMLKNYNFDVINRSRRANDTSKQCELLNISDDILDYDSDIYIIHLGIVDCAPRVFTRRESKVISLLPNFFRKLILKFVSKFRRIITKYRKITYVNSKKFQENLDFILKYLRNKKVILINILDTNELNIERSFGFDTNIKNYNKIIESFKKNENITLIDSNSLPCSKKLIEDGIHISKEMHKCLAEKILLELNERH